MYRVVKRDGEQVKFNVSKIGSAIEKAFVGCNKQYHPSVIDMLANSLHIPAKQKSHLLAVKPCGIFRDSDFQSDALIRLVHDDFAVFHR